MYDPVLRDFLGTRVFSMHVLSDFLSISRKLYFLLPFRKSKFAFFRYPKRDFHMYQSENNRHYVKGELIYMTRAWAMKDLSPRQESNP